ncbi:MAG: 3-hydroxyacyl-ACP dehydratase FabZ [Alphaproteobacteria bacterium]|nr:MAG: 3-hydroxyacyl-ACP dehydratase FabZ [Alphaproteobacteria bacterium]
MKLAGTSHHRDPKPQAATGRTLGIGTIMKYLPHRYPMLLVDRLIDVVPGESATGIKNVTINEPFFQGHFPGRPIMPGVLVIEAMAQTAAVLVVDNLPEAQRRNFVYFMSIEEARFRKPIIPGDTLYIRVRKLRQRGPVWRFRSEVMVDDVLCAEAVFTAMLPGDDAQGPNLDAL